MTLEVILRLLLSVGLIAASLAFARPAPAQDHDPAPAGPDRAAPLLIHGHYCGLGNDGLDVRPADALDAACRRHDLCFPAQGLPSCLCNARLQAEAARIAASARQPDDVREMARIVSGGAGVIACGSRAEAPRVRRTSRGPGRRIHAAADRGQ